MMRLFKRCLAGITLTTLCFQVWATPVPFSTLTRCDLAADHRISLLRGDAFSGSSVYKVRGAHGLQFLYEDSDASRGSDVHWKCVALDKHSNALVVSGEFTSNYIQGLLFYYDAAERKVNRISFAERNRPGWIWLSTQGTQVIFLNVGHESSHKYLRYGKNEAYQETDELPFPVSARGEKLIRLKL